MTSISHLNTAHNTRFVIHVHPAHGAVSVQLFVLHGDARLLQMVGYSVCAASS